MNVEKISEKENPLLLRKEIDFKIVYDKEKTPTKEQIKKFLAAMLKSDENLIVLNKINQIFGKWESKTNIYLYKSVEDFKKIEKEKKDGKKESKEQKNK